jgi:hypothetical protein
MKLYYCSAQRIIIAINLDGSYSVSIVNNLRYVIRSTVVSYIDSTGWRIISGWERDFFLPPRSPASLLFNVH